MTRKPLFVVGANNVVRCPQYGRRLRQVFATNAEAREKCLELRCAFKLLSIEEIEKFIGSKELCWNSEK